MDNKTNKLNELIEKGKEVKTKCYKTTDFGGYYGGEEYDTWMNNIKIFSYKYCREHVLYDDIITAYDTRNNSWSGDSFSKMMSYLESLRSDNDFINSTSDKSSTTSLSNQDKIVFLSHSSADLSYVKPFVKLIEDIGLKTKSDLFCSSISGYGIPTGQHIYDYLKSKFDNELHVICILSDNYYNSPACLNEMGAAWVKSESEMAILLPEFQYSQVRGAIDASKIWFKMNESDRLEEFKDRLIAEFDLKELEYSFWSRRKNEFIEEIEKVVEMNKHKQTSQKVSIEGIEENDTNGFKFYLRFENKTKKILKCTYLRMKVFDRNKGEIEVEISINELKHVKIFDYENKKLEVNVPFKNCKIISEFNPYIWDSFEILDSGWSNNI